MPYSPIRIAQLDQAGLSGFIASVVQNGNAILLYGDQLSISGRKGFLGTIDFTGNISTSGGINFNRTNYNLNPYGQFEVGALSNISIDPFLAQAYDLSSSALIALDWNQRSLSGQWSCSAAPSLPGHLLNLGYLNTGSFQNTYFVNTTSGQNITGVKTFVNSISAPSGINVTNLSIFSPVYQDGDTIYETNSGNNVSFSKAQLQNGAAVYLNWTGQQLTGGGWKSDNLNPSLPSHIINYGYLTGGALVSILNLATTSGNNNFIGSNNFVNNNNFTGNNNFVGNNNFSGNNNFTGNNTFGGLTLSSSGTLNSGLQTFYNPLQSQFFDNSGNNSLNYNSRTLSGQWTVGSGSQLTAPIVTSINNGQLAGYRNKIINGDILVAQGGTGFAAANGYTLDQWIWASVGAVVVTASQASDAPPSNEFQYSLRTTVTTADTSIASGDVAVITQNIEGYNVRDLIGRTFTLSFWVKSSVTGIHCVSFANSIPDRSYVLEYTINAANTWEFKSVIVSGGLITTGTWNWTNGIGMTIRWALEGGTTWQTTAGVWQTGNLTNTSNQVNDVATIGNIFALTGIQLEIGTQATPFEHIDYGMSLARCQRYFEICGSSFLGTWSSASQCEIVGPWKVIKRVAPSVAMLTTTPSMLELRIGYHTGTSSALTVGNSTINGGRLIVNGFSGATTANFATLDSDIFSVSSRL